MKRFPENAKPGQPQALIPESDEEWRAIEIDDFPLRKAAILAGSAFAFGIIASAIIIMTYMPR